MPKAYSYIRFSTPEQLQGDSLRRQTALAAEYCRKHGLDLDDSLTFRDLGVSAFRSTNSRSGALRAFLDAVEGGLVPRGSYLLVESLDRITRDDILAAQGLFLQIVSSGVTLVTLGDGRSYSQKSVIENPTELIISLLVMMRANEESVTKARRGAASWAQKRARATEKPLTAMCPAWMRLDKAQGRIVLIPEKAETVRGIFAMALAGHGIDGIAKQLNTASVPLLNGGMRSAKLWYPSYVRRILSNPAVIGTYIPHRNEYAGGKLRRIPQNPIENYYPTAVTQETYQNVQALMGSRSPRRGKHAAAPLVNILGGLARCPACGGGMVLVNKGAKNRRKFVCVAAKQGAGCTYVSVDYEQVEGALLDQIYYLFSECPAQHAEEAHIRSELQRLEASGLVLQDLIENLVEAIEKQGAKGKKSDVLLSKLAEYEDAWRQLKAQEEALLTKLDAVARTMIDHRIAMLQEALEENPMDKAKVNAGLRSLFTSVILDYAEGELKFQWAHGGSTDLMYTFPDQGQRYAQKSPHLRT